MKKFRKSLICACTVMMGLSGSQVFAQDITVTNVENVGVTATDLEVSPRDEFIKKVNDKVTLNVIHAKGMEYKEWIKTDLAYLGNNAKQKKITVKLLNSEIAELHKELLVFKTYDRIELNGATIEPYHVTAIKDALMYAIEVREDMLVRLNRGDSDLSKAIYLDREVTLGRSMFDIYDKTAGLNPLASADKVSSSSELLSILYDMRDYNALSNVETEELDMIAGALYDVLTNKKLPENLVKNINFYVAPYRFYGYLGFTTSADLIGREEEIFIGVGTEKSTYYTILDTILHELGHVYQADLIGMYSGANDLKGERVQHFDKWSKLKELLDCQDLRDCITSTDKNHYIAESMAEHFRVTMYKYLGFNIKSASETTYPYVTKVEKFILNDIKGYSGVQTYNSTPELFINGEKIESFDYNSKHYESYNINSKGMVDLLFKIENPNKQAVIKYDLLVRVGDEPKRLVTNRPITDGFLDSLKLAKGEYAITIHSDDTLYRFMDFYIK